MQRDETPKPIEDPDRSIFLGEVIIDTSPVRGQIFPAGGDGPWPFPDRTTRTMVEQPPSTTTVDAAQQVSGPEPSAARHSPGHAYDGNEYEVVRLRLEPLTIAFACVPVIFGWFPFYFRFVRAGWEIAFGIAFCLTVIGTLAALRARRPPHRAGFASLVALILHLGLMASIVVPAMGYYSVLHWPRL